MIATEACLRREGGRRVRVRVEDEDYQCLFREWQGDAMQALQAYQALLSRQDNLARAWSMRSMIEQRGGRIEFEPPSSNGFVVVTLWLPSHLQPNDFFPEIPFYPV